MKNVNMITLKAAFDYANEGKKSVPMAELQKLCIMPKEVKQHWTYIGDWRKVSPYFHGKRSA